MEGVQDPQFGSSGPKTHYSLDGKEAKFVPDGGDHVEDVFEGVHCFYDEGNIPKKVQPGWRVRVSFAKTTVTIKAVLFIISLAKLMDHVKRGDTLWFAAKPGKKGNRPPFPRIATLEQGKWVPIYETPEAKECVLSFEDAIERLKNHPNAY